MKTNAIDNRGGRRENMSAGDYIEKLMNMNF